MPTWGIVATLSSIIGSLVTGIISAIYTGRLIPGKTVDRLRDGQQQTVDLWRETAETERRRADSQQEDLLKLMRELAEMLRRSRPDGSR